MFKKLAIGSLTAVMFGAASVAVAHTGIKDKAIEGTSTYSLYTAFTIGHGCGSAANAVQLPVIAQSAVFPNAADSKWTQLDAAGAPVGNLTMADVIQGSTFLSPGLIQDKSVFAYQRETTDALLNVRGFRMKAGSLLPELTGLVPFKVSIPKFQPTSCAKSLKVRIAIANWCKSSITNTAEPADKDRRADFWLGVATTKFNDPLVSSIPVAATATAGYWPTLTINRDLLANPLPAACNGGFDAAVEPSAADIDKYLPMGMGAFPLGNL